MFLYMGRPTKIFRTRLMEMKIKAKCGKCHTEQIMKVRETGKGKNNIAY